MATDKLEMALKNAIKTTSDFCEFRGIKRLTTEGIWLFDENETEKVFMVAVNHKAIQISEWSVSFEEETCNFSVFEVHVRKDDGSMEALYDGSGWTDRETLVCDFVSWGDFTNEIARMWLSQIYLGTESEEARDECLKAMGVKTGDDEEQETTEVPSEAPAEPETAEMNDYMKKQVLLNVDRLNNVQQEVVCIEEYVDEAYDSIKVMTGSYRFDGVPEDFREKVRDYQSRLCKLHNEIYDLYSEMEKTCYETRKQVKMP